jgi:hypothetical protein
MIVLYLGHLFIDQFRTFIFTDNSKGKGLLLLFLDQLAHIILIGLIAWGATGWIFSDLNPLTTEAVNQARLIVYLIGLTIAVSVVPVLEAETTVAVLAFLGTEINYTVAIETADRMLGAGERIIAVIVILLGYWFIAPVIFLPRLIYMIRQGQFETDKVGVITKVATSFVAMLVVALILLNIPIPALA